jgi:hypothetical protein
MVGGHDVGCTTTFHTFTADDGGTIATEKVWLIPGQLAFIFMEA